jgi:hypothetical protein
MYHLIVREPFAFYTKGQRIEAPDEVTKILAGPNEGHVLKVNAPPAPVQTSEPLPLPKGRLA